MQTKSENFSIKKSLFDRVVVWMLILAACSLESPDILRLFTKGITRLPYRLALVVAMLAILSRLRDSPFNRSIIDIFAITLIYKLGFLLSCFPDSAVAYTAFYSIERPLMSTIFYVLIVRALWPDNVPFPGLPLRTNNDPFFVPSVWPYVAIAACATVGLISADWLAKWLHAVGAAVALLIVAIYGRDTSDKLEKLIDEDSRKSALLPLYEQTLKQTADLIERLKNKSQTETGTKDQ